MTVYLAAAAAALFYLLALPVRAGAAWKTGGPLRLGLTVGPLRFSAHGSLTYVPGSGLTASLTQDRSGRTRELTFSGASFDPAAVSAQLSAASGAFKFLVRHIHARRFRAMLHLRLPDAAKTALLYGFFASSFRLLRAVRPHFPLTASVSADFRPGKTQFDLYGILSCRLGHIMAAGLIALRDYLSGRLHTWIANSRSKAS